MASIEEQILKATKEIVVKYIETGRLSPAAFHDTFREVYYTVAQTVKSDDSVPEPPENTGG
jgi:hypothetical protein